MVVVVVLLWADANPTAHPHPPTAEALSEKLDMFVCCGRPPPLPCLIESSPPPHSHSDIVMEIDCSLLTIDIHSLFGFFCNPFMDSPNHCAGVDWGRTEGVYCSRENNNNFSGIIQLTETRGGWVWCFYLKVELILFFWISSEIEWERAQLNQLWTAACQDAS